MTQKPKGEVSIKLAGQLGQRAKAELRRRGSLAIVETLIPSEATARNLGTRALAAYRKAAGADVLRILQAQHDSWKPAFSHIAERATRIG
jgi:hypothetical protein